MNIALESENILVTDHPCAGEIKEAKRHPGGWVYRIAGHFGPSDAVPPEAIVGAWKVDDGGNISGDFIRNEKYNAVRWPATSQSAIVARPKAYWIVMMIMAFAMGVYLTSAAAMNIWLAYHPLYTEQFRSHLAWAGIFCLAVLGCAGFEFWAVRRLWRK
jgi:hypothetical protein